MDQIFFAAGTIKSQFGSRKYTEIKFTTTHHKKPTIHASNEKCIYVALGAYIPFEPHERWLYTHL